MTLGKLITMCIGLHIRKMGMIMISNLRLDSILIKLQDTQNESAVYILKDNFLSLYHWPVERKKIKQLLGNRL